MISAVASRYGRAIFEASKESQSLELVNLELKAVASSVFKDSNIQQYFTSPLVDLETKKNWIQNTLGSKVHPNTLHLILILLENNRLNLMEQITQVMSDLVDTTKGVRRGVVQTSAGISDSGLQKLEQVISGIIGKKVILQAVKSPELLGGISAQVGGWTFDDTIDSHFDRLKEEINRRSV